MIEIFADSCSDLSPELIDHFHIHIIPLYVYENGVNYLDGKTITTPQLFELVKESGVLPKTSAPSEGDFLTNFAQADEAIFIGISSKLSASIQNAINASNSLKNKKILVIDSLTLSSGIGLLVLKAAELRDAGKSLEEIGEEIKNSVPKLNVSFVIDTLDYMYMGGRCSSMEHLVGSLLKIRPVIEVRPDGTLGVKTKIGGSRKKALNSMLDDFKSKLPNIDLHRVFVTHTYCDEDAEYLKSELLKLAPIEEVCITYAGSTIASHCGPNTIGILFFGK